jgi:hypothetical protein
MERMEAFNVGAIVAITNTRHSRSDIIKNQQTTTVSSVKT